LWLLRNGEHNWFDEALGVSNSQRAITERCAAAIREHLDSPSTQREIALSCLASEASVILTQMPDLLPRPETSRNAEFRRQFYSRWGKENSIVCGKSRYAEYAKFRQTLSIKTIVNGTEHYFVDRRRLSVSDETYLVLNENREYSSVLETPEDAFSFCIFFRPGLANEIAADSRRSVARALDAGSEARFVPMEFSEHLRRHDKDLTAALRHVRRHVVAGVTDMGWYDEQFNFLLERLICNERALALEYERLDCINKARRRELIRRLRQSTDFIHSNLQRKLSLAEIARAACLSEYHYLRLFGQVFQMTPMSYLRVQRVQRAIALLQSSSMEIQEIAAQVGFTRLSLWRNVKRAIGEGPLKMRQRDKSTAHESNGTCRNLGIGACP
jgi:AraC-like DNA-binding protein